MNPVTVVVKMTMAVFVQGLRIYSFTLVYTLLIIDTMVDF